MKYIISATNRPGANSLIVAGILQSIYKKLNYPTEIISLKEVPFQILLKNPYSEQLPADINKLISKLNNSSAFTIVCPEYNGSFPGIFKFFIDHWSYPETFEYRPIAFVGLGGRFGGLRAVEQMQQIMGYRNAFIYPQRVFLQNVSELLCDGTIKDQEIRDLLGQQAEGFLKFISALEEKKLSALFYNNRI
ncbi:MAG: NAD(P)H-dependent oxidoreductase [Bdellovibrionales bacterium]|nr:NAD(P)H-dependent oxidoreductase [Bdellovibrionales bacterium]